MRIFWFSFCYWYLASLYFVHLQHFEVYRDFLYGLTHGSLMKGSFPCARQKNVCSVVLGEVFCTWLLHEVVYGVVLLLYFLSNLLLRCSIHYWKWVLNFPTIIVNCLFFLQFCSVCHFGILLFGVYIFLIVTFSRWYEYSHPNSVLIKLHTKCLFFSFHIWLIFMHFVHKWVFHRQHRYG